MNQPLIHNVPFSQMDMYQQHALVMSTFAAAVQEISQIEDYDKQKELRKALDKAMDKGTAMGQHAAIFAVRAITRNTVRKAQQEVADAQQA